MDKVTNINETADAEFEEVPTENPLNELREQALQQTQGRMQSVANMASQLLIAGVEKFGLNSMKAEHIAKALDLADQFGASVELMHQEQVDAVNKHWNSLGENSEKIE